MFGNKAVCFGILKRTTRLEIFEFIGTISIVYYYNEEYASVQQEEVRIFIYF